MTTQKQIILRTTSIFVLSVRTRYITVADLTLSDALVVSLTAEVARCNILRNNAIIIIQSVTNSNTCYLRCATRAIGYRDYILVLIKLYMYYICLHQIKWPPGHTLCNCYFILFSCLNISLLVTDTNVTYDSQSHQHRPQGNLCQGHTCSLVVHTFWLQDSKSLWRSRILSHNNDATVITKAMVCLSLLHYGELGIAEDRKVKISLSSKVMR